MARPPRTPRTPRPPRSARPSRPPRDRSTKPPAGLPTRKQVLDFIASSDQPAGKREIARAFGLKGNEKIALKALLQGHGRRRVDRQLARAARSTKWAACPRSPCCASSRPTTAARSGRCRSNGMRRRRRRGSALIERDRRSALGIGDRVLCPDRGKGRRLHRPSDEEARALGRAGAGRGAARGRRASGCRRSTRRSGASCPSAT